MKLYKVFIINNKNKQNGNDQIQNQYKMWSVRS